MDGILRMKTILERCMARFADDDDGATAIEYGLIAALIAVAIIGSLTAISESLSTTFSEVDFDVETATD